eukprot:TRINITY_DN5983_c0_g1_i1.p1 TRINITY_DN5983_c0_g1~~TRINITY_DN5983_c0_g1_i1.p1  ORF type:complete len:160 (-),score=26.54 TRINITY_DN5983_c0_g1_i1:145-624(-)
MENSKSFFNNFAVFATFLRLQNIINNGQKHSQSDEFIRSYIQIVSSFGENSTVHQFLHGALMEYINTCEMGQFGNFLKLVLTNLKGACKEDHMFASLRIFGDLLRDLRGGRKWSYLSNCVSEFLMSFAQICASPLKGDTKTVVGALQKYLRFGRKNSRT